MATEQHIDLSTGDSSEREVDQPAIRVVPDQVAAAARRKRAEAVARLRFCAADRNPGYSAGGRLLGEILADLLTVMGLDE